MKKYSLIIFVLVVGFLLFYFNLPVIRFGFYGIGIIVLVLLFFYFIFSLGIKLDKSGKKFVLSSQPSKWLLRIMGLIIVYLTIVPFFTSATILHASRYQKLIGNVENGAKISTHIAPISVDKIRVVDQSLAYLLGEKVIGSQPALGRQEDPSCRWPRPF